MKPTEPNNLSNNSQQLGHEHDRALRSYVRTKILNRGVVPICDDIEPVEVSHEDVRMETIQKKEPLEAEVPRARMNPKNPGAERNKIIKILNMLFSEICVLRVSKAEGLADNIELKCWRKGTRKNHSDCCF